MKFDSHGALATDFGALSSATGNSTAYFSGYAGQLLNPGLTVSDTELAASANAYKGAVLSLARESGANADDHFVATGELVFRSGLVYLGNTNVGTVQSGTGTLKITFNDKATQALVNQTLQSIAYENTGTVVDQQHIRIQWNFKDGAGSDALQAQSVTDVTVHSTSAPYWIDALLDREGGLTQAALLAALGKGHGTRLAYDANSGDRAFTTAEKSMIEGVLNGIRAFVNLPAKDDGALITVHHAGEAAQGRQEAIGNLADGADIYFEPSGNTQAANSQVLLHALAHTLGLKHGDETTSQNGALPAADSKATVTASATFQGQTLGTLDIAALQYLFGPNPLARTGNDTYALSASQANFIWDGAGNDTISAAGLSGDLTLHLEPGYWDYIGAKGQSITAGGQLTVNYGSAIENATGGDGNDDITGTAGANILRGGKGNDRLTGLAGDDTLIGGDGTDTAVYAGTRSSYKVEASAGGYIVTGAEGRDTLSGIERLQFSDGVKVLNWLPTGQLTITGTPEQNQLLTAVSTLADADGIGTLRYQWYAGDKAIAGATGSSLVLTKSDVGKSISVTASYTDGGGTSEAVTSAGTALVTRVNSLPTGNVTLSGKAVENQTMSVSHTLADADGLGQVSYQWYADGSPLTGATTSFLLLTDSLVGKKLSATASYTDAFGTLESVASIQSTAVENVNNAPAGQVAIHGDATMYQTLSATQSLTDGDGMGAIIYQWYADNAAIAGAAGETLVLTRALAGKAISVHITYVDGHGTAESVSSAATAPVAYVNSPGAVSIAADGARMTATVSDADGVAQAAYRWETSADGKTWATIADGAASVVTLPGADAGKLVRVTATYVDQGGTAEANAAQLALGTGAPLVGGAARDTLRGSSGNDVLNGGAGDDVLHGGDGLDTAIFSGPSANYTVTRANGGLLVTDNSGHDGSDQLAGVERLQFSDRTIAFDLDGAAGQAYRLYQAAFDRTPDSTGLGYWIAMMDKGMPLSVVADSFATSQEFRQLLGENLGSRDVVTAIYHNVLHRAPEASGLDFWVNILETKAAPLSLVLTSFSESGENQAALIGVTSGGIAYTPYIG